MHCMYVVWPNDNSTSLLNGIFFWDSCLSWHHKGKPVRVLMKQDRMVVGLVVVSALVTVPSDICSPMSIESVIPIECSQC